MTPDGPPVPDEPPIFPSRARPTLFCSKRGVVFLFEAGCGVAIATAGRTSGQFYYRVPRFRGGAVVIREPSLPACGGCCGRGWADCPARCRVREPPSLLATGRSWKPV